MKTLLILFLIFGQLVIQQERIPMFNIEQFECECLTGLDEGEECICGISDEEYIDIVNRYNDANIPEFEDFEEE